MTTHKKHLYEFDTNLKFSDITEDKLIDFLYFLLYDLNPLQKKLEDERYRDEWQELHEELKEKERQLEELKK